MSYPGNSSLAEEIQQKILSTFLQTLDLAEQGRKEEALLGCDFIRRLDSMFAPAERLLERLESQEGPIDVDDLRAALTSEPADASPPSSPRAATDTEVDELFAALDSAEEPGEEDLESFELSEEEIDSASDVYVLEDPADQPEPESPGEAAAAAPEVAPEPVPEPATQTPTEAAPPEQATTAAEPEATPPLDAGSAPEPTAALDRESEERVEQLLAEGQEAFEATEYQSAIDAWSRIFLIDIDHPEANRRIELARKLKAEVERKAEESFHDALAAMESGNLDAAADGFRKVLSLQHTHLAAQEHLDKLTAGEYAPTTDDGDLASVDDLAPLASLQSDVDALPVEESAAGDADFEPLVPPPPGSVPAVDTATEAPRPSPKRRPSRQTALVIAGLVLVIAVAAAWFLRSNWTRFFPNAGEEAATTTPTRPKVDPIVRAQGLHVDGNTAMAISQLRRLPPAHPQYAEAQALIAQWETVLEEDIQQAGPSTEERTERDRLVARAREAFANREFLQAEKYFSLAAQAAPLEDGALALQAETIERLEPLRTEIEIFRQGEWAYALRSLWLKYEADPGNPDVRRLMTDGYVNLGVRDLQRGDPLAALENLSEAASLAGDDAEVQRLIDFATIYTQRQPDLQYRIFVKYLPFR